MVRGIGQQFSEDGFSVVRGLFAESDVAFYIARLKELAGGKDRWTQADGINRHSAFWPVIFNDGLLASVREIFGPAVRYLPHNDLHLGFSSFAWHRDNVSRHTGLGADWDETRDAYQLARVGIYLQAFEESRFKLGFIKGSHRPERAFTGAQRRLNRRTSAAANVLSGLSGVDLVGSHAEWIATEPGDCVIFDPRILHTGSRFHGAKYSMFLAFGVESPHFHNHWHYYLNLRKDLGYSSIDPRLADLLRAADLLADEPPPDLQIKSAWIPSSTYTYVARRFK
jgi:Phytanoyl-CoA dioxygenase (PhyH)